MVYFIPYEADFECPKGHRFVSEAHPLQRSEPTPMCPTCYTEWIAANVPNAKQISEAREKPNTCSVSYD